MQYTTERKQLAINDFQLNIQRGISDKTAKTIVFLHDSLGCNVLWRDFPQRLASSLGYNYLVYDRRGYGLSSPFASGPRPVNYMELEADILIEILEAEGITRPVLFGHSDGGTIALLAAAKFPDHFSAILTEGAHVFVEEITLDGIAHSKYQFETSNLKERLEKYHGKNAAPLFLAWTETWLSAGFRNWNIEHFLPAIHCPIMAIQGVDDEFGSIEQVKAIAGKVSGKSHICMIPNAGHSPHKQNELWLISECCNFIESNIP